MTKFVNVKEFSGGGTIEEVTAGLKALNELVSRSGEVLFDEQINRLQRRRIIWDDEIRLNLKAHLKMQTVAEIFDWLCIISIFTLIVLVFSWL